MNSMMPSPRWFLTLLIWLAPLLSDSPATAGELPPPPTGSVGISLSQALQQALQRNSSLAQSTQDLASAEAAEMGARAVFDPTFSLSVDGSDYRGGSGGQSIFGSANADSIQADAGGQVGISGYLPTGTTLSASLNQRWQRQYQLYPDAFGGEDLESNSKYWATQLSFGLSQNLLKGLGTSYNFASFRLAVAARNAAELTRLQQAAQVAGDVVKAYLDLGYAVKAHEIARLSLSRARDQREVAKARIEVGDLAPIELWKIEETVASREGDLLQAEVNVRLAAQRLQLLLPDSERREGAPQLWPTEEAGNLLPTRDATASRQEALTGNLSLLVQREQLSQSRISLAVATHDRLPSLDLEASLALNGYRNVGEDVEDPEEGPFHSTNRTLAIGATLSVPLGGRSAQATFRQRRAEVEKALLQQRALEDQTLALVDQALWNIENWDEQTRVAQARVESARKSVEAETARYQVGKTTTREVLDAEAILKEAELQAERAVVEARKVRVDLEMVRGSLLQALGLEVR